MSEVDRTSNANWRLTCTGGSARVAYNDAQADRNGLSQDALELRVDGELFALCEPSNDLRRRQSTIDLPAECFDGATHVIEAVERSSGQHAVGSPRHFRDDSGVRAAVQALDGTAVVGWVETPDDIGPIDLTLLIDNTPVARQAVARSSDRRRTFRLPVPKEWLDGLPHLLTVKVTETGNVLGHLAEALPSIATPWPSLQRHGGPTLPAASSPAASRRYENLAHWLKESSRQRDNRRLDDPFPQLAHAHEILVRGWEAVRDFAPLSLPRLEHPMVSVIVPVHNNAAITYTCLAALTFAYNQTPFEVIVVDDGSSDETMTLAEAVDGVTFVRNETAQGFVRACNLGARHARGRYFVFLNNDTEPTAEWLDELLYAFDAFPDVGLAGSKLLFQDGRLQDAGGIVWNTGNPWNYGRGGNPEDPRYNYTRQVDYVSGAALMVSRDVWEAVGGFSEAFCPAYFEDTDLAFKVQASGKRVVYVPASVVYHLDGMSRAAGTEHDVKKYQEINRPTFKRRWIYAYQSNGDEGKNFDLVKDRNVAYRALVIDHHVPQPDRDAGSYAAIQEIRLLQALGCKVTFLPLNFAHLGSYTQELQRLGVECLHAPYFSSVRDVLTQRGAEFDLVYITRYTAARRVLKEIRQLAPQAKVLFCNADLHFLRTLRVALAESDRAALDKAKWIRDEELKVMRQADVVLSYNEVEHAVILSHNLDRSKVVLAPWVVDVQDEVPPFDERSDVAFLGGFGHPPNLPAVQFFIQEVMPLLRQRLPGVRFRVFGSNVPDELRALHADDVLIEGYVEDLAQVYDACRVFVAPLLTGAGLKGKVVDALAHGTPSVLSPIAAEGIGIRHGLEALIAATPAEWVAAIAALYEDPERWQAMSTQSRAFAREAYSFERGWQLMAKAFAAAGIAVPTAPRALVATSTRAQQRRQSLRIEESRDEEPGTTTPPRAGDRIVSPDFRPVASHLFTAPLPSADSLVLVADSDVGPILTDPHEKEVGGWLREKGTWAPGEGRFLRGILQPGMNAIDIGAYIGYFTLLFAREVGPSGRVLAVEFVPEHFLKLRANIALNDLENVELLPVAAHRQTGMIESLHSPTDLGGHFGTPDPSFPQQAVRLDDILHPDTPVDAIKIDIEGMDHWAVQGLEATIRRWHPTLLVEYFPLSIERVGDDPVAVLRYYRSLGLQIRVIGADALQLRHHAGLDLDELVDHDLCIPEVLDEKIASLTASIGLINLALTPHGRTSAADSRRQPATTLPQCGGRIVSPDFRPVASHLLTEPLPPTDNLVLVPDSDVGPILTDPRDKEIGGWLREKRTWAPAEGRFLRKFLQPGMNVIDVGANIGYFTLLSAHAVGPSGRVLAVEAEPEFCLQLRANVDLNNLDNVELLPLAAHRQSGMLGIWRNPENFGGSFVTPLDPDSTSTPIQAVRLDDVLNPDTPIDAIKIDIEGMDHAAVQGLEATIQRWRPTLLVEYHPLAIELFGEDPVAVLAYYRSLGLQVRVLGTDARRLRDYASMDLDELVSRDLVITEDLDARIAELTHPIGLINLVLTPLGRSATATER